MPVVPVADAKLHYRFDGPEDAPVLVLSNSLGTSLAMWDAQVPAFSRSRRVLRYDTRGHGQSGVTPGPYAIAQLARDVLGLADALGVRTFDFCGLSMGGMIGQWLGAYAADRLRTLVLCNTTARIDPAPYAARIASVRSGGMAAVTEAVLLRWFTAPFMREQPETVGHVRAQLLATPPEGYIACCEAVRDMDQRETAARISCRTLVIAGTHDVATPPADGRWIAERIAGARLVELPAAHLSNVEQPRAFTEAVTGFLDA